MEDERITMEEFREFIFKLHPDTKPEEWAVHEERLRKSFICATQNIGQEHVLGSPLFDILSVSLQLKLPRLRKREGWWRIFGDIRVPQVYNPPRDQTTYLRMFKRDFNHSQPLDPKFTFLDLDLANPVYDFFPSIDINFELYAKRPRHSDKVLLIKDDLSVDYTNFPENLFDRVQQREFDTENVCLRIKYVTYRNAILAKVNFVLDVATEQQSRGLNVSGKIYASWHHKKEDFEQHQQHEDHCSCVCLFNSSSTKVITGQPFQLTRPVIGVPAYATLMLEFILRVEGVDFYHVLDSPVRDIDISNLEFQVSNGLVGRVKMQWANKYYYDDDDDEEEETTPTGSQKKTKLTLQQIPKPICIYDTVLNVKFDGEEMMEIFSVYIGLNDKINPCRINGTIDVKDDSGSHRIFEINDPNFTNFFSHGMTLPLVGPEMCLEGSFFLQVHLRDDKGQEFCRGYVGWSMPILRDPWLDKFLCSVIKGKIGFAEINYTLLPSAVASAVSVFLSAPSSCENVHIRGSIFGQYKTKYPTTFQKKYIRSVLLQKEDESGPMVLEFGAKRQLMDIPTSSRSQVLMLNEYWISLPLTKSVVCVPTDDILRIEVDLSVKCESVAVVERLMGCVEFNIGHKTWHMIKSDNYQIFVSVDWA